VTVPLQLSVDVDTSEGSFETVVVGVLMSGAQNGPMLAVERCVPLMEKYGDNVPYVVIVRVPVGNPLPERTVLAL